MQQLFFTFSVRYPSITEYKFGRPATDAYHLYETPVRYIDGQIYWYIDICTYVVVVNQISCQEFWGQGVAMYPQLIQQMNFIIIDLDN